MYKARVLLQSINKNHGEESFAVVLNNIFVRYYRCAWIMWLHLQPQVNVYNHS